MTKTYKFRNANGEQTVQARTAKDALSKAVQATRRGRMWHPDKGSEHAVTRLVTVVCVDDANDEAADYVQMWP